MSFCLRCFGANVQPSYLIFEDLSIKGFKNADRKCGFDMAHFKLVMAKIAKWHAATAVLGEQVFI